MGYYLATLREPLNGIDYIGSQTTYNAADAGVFSGTVSPYWNDFAEAYDMVMGVVTGKDIPTAIQALDGVAGRDVEKLKQLLSTTYKEGFVLLS